MRLPDFELERFFAAREGRVQASLSPTDPDPVSLGEVFRQCPSLMPALHKVSLDYADTLGLWSFREAVAATYQGITPEQVMITVGSAEAIMTAMHCSIKPGDLVLVQSPCYQSLRSWPEALGASVELWEAKLENGSWVWDLDQLSVMLQKKPSLLVINTPHNPTGFNFSLAQWRQITDMAERSGVMILCDEVYRGLEHQPEDKLPAVAEMYSQGISIAGMSKAYGLPGLRLGWAVVPDPVRFSQMAAVKDYTTICASAVNQLIAEHALNIRDARLREIVSVIRRNREFLAGLSVSGVSIPMPIAGPVAFPRVQDSAVDIAAVSDRVLDKTGLLAVPGSLYGKAWCSHFRLGLARRAMPERLTMFLENLVGESRVLSC